MNHFIGFTSPIEYGMTWEELYVELDMVKAHGHSKHEVFAGLEEEGEGEREKKKVGLDDAFRHASRCKKRTMVMLGDPGSGKTTQLQQMLLRVLDEARGPTSLGLPAGTVPVFVAIRDLRLPEGRAVPKLEELVREALPETLDGVSAELAGRLLAQGSVLYLRTCSMAWTRSPMRRSGPELVELVAGAKRHEQLGALAAARRVHQRMDQAVDLVEIAARRRHDPQPLDLLVPLRSRHEPRELGRSRCWTGRVGFSPFLPLADTYAAYPLMNTVERWAIIVLDWGDLDALLLAW